MKTDAPAIARLKLIRLRPSGERVPIAVEIGHPYRSETGEWRTPTALHGWHERLGDICGEDSFQSLCLAMDLVRRLVTFAIGKGDRFLDPRGGDFPIEAYFPKIDSPSHPTMRPLWKVAQHKMSCNRKPMWFKRRKKRTRD